MGVEMTIALAGRTFDPEKRAWLCRHPLCVLFLMATRPPRGRDRELALA
jgi:hypothetical protein